MNKYTNWILIGALLIGLIVWKWKDIKKMFSADTTSVADPDLVPKNKSTATEVDDCANATEWLFSFDIEEVKSHVAFGSPKLTKQEALDKIQSFTFRATTIFGAHTVEWRGLQVQTGDIQFIVKSKKAQATIVAGLKAVKMPHEMTCLG
jgi:hypothetical protein